MADGLVKCEAPDEVGRSVDVDDEGWQRKAANCLLKEGYLQLRHAKSEQVRQRYWESLTELNPLLRQVRDKAGRAKSMEKSLEELEKLVLAKDVSG
jgi:hypothetical protein